MADFTSNMLTESGGTMSAMANIIFKIFEAVSEGRKNRMARQKMKAERQMMKDRHEDHEIAMRKNELNSISGLVPNSVMQEMREVGIPTQYISFKDMSPENYAKFCEQCEMSGVAYSGIANGSGGYTIHCRTSDMPVIRDIMDSLITETQLDSVEQAKQAILNNGNLTEEQKQEALQELDRQSDDIQRDAFSKFNDKQTAAGINDVIADNSVITGAIGFEKALNRNVSYLDGMNDRPYYIVDAVNPDRFIECTETKYTDIKGQDKIGTEYNVYDMSKSDAPLMTADDFNRNGIDSKDWATGQWAQTKAGIKETGDFSECVYKVDCKERLDAMRGQYTEKQPNIAPSMSNAQKAAVIEAKFNTGGEYENITPPAQMPGIDVNNIQPAQIMSARAYIDSERIKNYKEQATIEQQPKTPEAAKKLNELKAREKTLETHGNFLNAASAEHSTRGIRPADIAKETPIAQQKTTTRGADKARPTTKALEKQINQQKQAHSPSSDALAKVAAKAAGKGAER